MIESGDVRLRPIEDADAENIVTWRNNPQVRRNFIFQQDFTVPMQLGWMETHVRTGKVAQFIIEELQSGRDVGSVFIRDIDHVHRKGEFGIFIGDDTMRGRGIGTRATALILSHGFELLGLNKIFLRVFADNERAIRSYERSGFVREGFLREDVFVDGRFRDLVLMAVLTTRRI
ncbi:MAG TPA: GNAT family protein [Gryllotalpicola sp.]